MRKDSDHRGSRQTPVLKGLTDWRPMMARFAGRMMRSDKTHPATGRMRARPLPENTRASRGAVANPPATPRSSNAQRILTHILLFPRAVLLPQLVSAMDGGETASRMMDLKSASDMTLRAASVVPPGLVTRRRSSGRYPRTGRRGRRRRRRSGGRATQATPGGSPWLIPASARASIR